ncbi:sensor histidine kinase [Paenibacillus jilunlii]|uniref:sensor histidine kinase n=1 Tax=Paenibacillus jilunlii TaxID=682956 RepID=UPI0007841782|nr:HAMP domain-containing sensor histidine kinase [Paenibacillus jilunlii]
MVIKWTKKLRTGLVGELVLIFILSLAATLVTVSLTAHFLKGSALFYPAQTDAERIMNYREKVGNPLAAWLDTRASKAAIPHQLEQELRATFPLDYDKSFRAAEEVVVSVVNGQGELLQANSQVVIVRSGETLPGGKALLSTADYSPAPEAGGFVIGNPEKEQVYNIVFFAPKEGISISYNNSSGTKLQETRKLGNGLYLVAVSTFTYTENPVSLLGIVVFLLLFYLGVRGRIRYMRTLKRGTHTLYATDFEARIPLKYNNELTTMAAALNDMAEQIAASRSKEKDFLLNISHDLRTPLTSIMGFLSLLKEKSYDSEPEKERYIEVLEERTGYLKKLIDEFFEISQLKWKPAVMNKSRVNMQELLRQVVVGYHPQSRDRRIETVLLLPDQSVHVEIDADLFVRVLENLLSNAFKYSRPDTELIIRLREPVAENRRHIPLRLELWSTPAQTMGSVELHRLFDRFYKGDSSRTGEGAGLGLSIAAEIIRLHGGKLDARIEGERLGMIIELFMAY